MSEEEQILECACWKEAGVENCLISSQLSFDAEEKKWVVYVGFIERCAKCHGSLGEGYGDEESFAMEDEAKKSHLENLELKGKWFS